MNVAPVGWSPRKLGAWNDLMDAVSDYEAFEAAVVRMNVTSPAVLQLGADVKTLITAVLVPAVLANP